MSEVGEGEEGEEGDEMRRSCRSTSVIEYSRLSEVL